MEQIISAQLEQLVWGDRFLHVGDLIVTVLLALAYAHAAHRLSIQIAASVPVARIERDTD